MKKRKPAKPRPSRSSASTSQLVKRIGRQFPFWLLPENEKDIETIKCQFKLDSSTNSIRFALRKVAEGCSQKHQAVAQPIKGSPKTRKSKPRRPKPRKAKRPSKRKAAKPKPTRKSRPKRKARRS